MFTIDQVKNRIKDFYTSNSIIHLSVFMSKPRVHAENEEARVVGVYPNIFQVEVGNRRYTLQYTDFFTNNIKIAELNEE